MPSEEGFDLPGAGGAQAGNGRPPTPSPRNAYRQLGQGLEAVCSDGPSGARRQPAVDVARHQRHGRRQMPQRFDPIHDRAGVLRALGCGVLQQAGQVFPMPLARVASEPAPDLELDASVFALDSTTNQYSTLLRFRMILFASFQIFANNGARLKKANSLQARKRAEQVGATRQWCSRAAPALVGRMLPRSCTDEREFRGVLCESISVCDTARIGVRMVGERNPHTSLGSDNSFPCDGRVAHLAAHGVG